MTRRAFTILILSRARSRFRKLHVSYGFAFVAATVVLALAAAGLAVPHLLFRVQAQALELSELEHHNLELRQQKIRFEDALTELNSRLNAHEERAQRLASELGVEDLESAGPAVGGAIHGDAYPAERSVPFAEELEALRYRAETLDRSFVELDDAWRERERMLASTPSTMPVRGWFSHGFGWRKDPFDGQRAFHRGIDIVAPVGTPVQAPADGVVTRAGRNGAYGKSIDMSHGYGYATRYGHLSEILVRPGQRVRRGETIGRLGSTGRSTGPHLHYEVFRDGRRVNPWRYLGEKGF